MHDPINLYGDTLITTSGYHGANITAQRLDALDKMALRHLLDWKEETPVACDIGCGSGTQGIRFALCGADVHLYDIVDMRDRVRHVMTGAPGIALTFHPGNVLDTFPASGLRALALAYSQRTIHYLRFDDASRLLHMIRQILLPGGRVFLSASGLASELGAGYEAKHTPIAQRFARLAPPMREKHEIHEPVCLYSETDMHTLAEHAGYHEVRVWSSEFRNVKAVFG